MAKTLVIKDVNYSANAFDHVNLIERVPCTDISLSKQSAEIIAIGGTTNITAVVTPIDTTDAITWSSSNDNIATVVDGIVTTAGVGTVTITATCGEQSATCVITSRAFMNTSNVIRRLGYACSGSDAETGGNGLATFRDVTDRGGGFVSNTGTLSFYDPNDIYPYVLPYGTKVIKISFAEGSRIYHVYNLLWFNHETYASGYPNNVQEIRKVYIEHSRMENPLVLDVPTIEGFPEIDSFAIGFRLQSGQMTNEDLDTITIEFLPEE